MPKPLASPAHPAYRDFRRARSEANQGINSLLVGLRLARYQLEGLPRSQADVLLGAYYRHEIADIRVYNYKASVALDHFETAEKDLAFMALPFATSVYEAFLSELARIVRHDGGGNIPTLPARSSFTST